MYSANDWIQRLALKAHPEGGYFKEVYRAAEQVAAYALPARFGGSRSLSTSIYFLVNYDRFSALHRLAADEIWHFYTGSSLEIHMIMQDGTYEKQVLGAHPENGEVFQAVVPAGCWFGAKTAQQDPEAYALVGCTLAPGFDFADFELGDRTQLLAEYPQHQALIRELTR